jgi:hypothetical protein
MDFGSKIVVFPIADGNVLNAHEFRRLFEGEVQIKASLFNVVSNRM